MSLSLNAGEVTRGDLYAVDPYQVMVREESRGRSFPPTQDQIVWLALDMLKNGQIQPVECKRVEEAGADKHKLRLVSGYTRCAAARLIRTGFTVDGVEHKREDFKLKCLIVVGMNEENMLLHNISENLVRTERSPIDDAGNAKRLINDYLYTPEAVAALFRCSEARITQILKLLSLDREQQYRVHTGDLSVAAALELLTIPEDRRKEVLESVEESGKVTTSAIRAVERKRELEAAKAAKETQTPVIPVASTPCLVENNILNDDNRKADFVAPAPTPVPPMATLKEIRKRPLSLSEIKTFWETLTDHPHKKVQHFADSFIGFMNGTVSEEETADALFSLLSK